ncbi:MAG: 3-methyl-2-oxobutanoate dehydrogenase subunit VorB [Clostridiales bacterium]|jgi:2-oxoglutarate ferredoxin oxidoreductase subunit alpha|nr:3-methyl-2-oxobutanoate dehydrogenase subunit VorB [Clostridiales bacterium]
MEKLMLKGNEAIAEAAITAGCLHFFGYPITPQTEVAAYMARKLPKIGGVYLQAESEVAAINMVIGAAAAGVRVMTSSSSPGISLKSEGLSYLSGCDLPAVIVNIQRGGPGLGGIQPSQSDYFQATRGSGHGDYHLIVLAPGTVQEIVDLTRRAFDLADKYRVGVMLLGDGVLGQMMEPAVIGEYTPAVPAKPWALTGASGRPKNIVNSLYLDPEELERTNFERFRKYEQIRRDEVLFEEYQTEDADLVLVGYGAPGRICRNAVAAARAEGLRAGLFRPVTLYPFPSEALKKLAERAKRFISVEMSMGQMVDDVRLAIECRRPVDTCLRTGGVIHTPAEILEKIRACAKEEGLI